jgi:tartrate-resistant acid phosphatase type 5
MPNMRTRFIATLVGLMALLPRAAGPSQQALPSPSAAFLELLDADLRERVRGCVPVSPSWEKAYAQMPAEPRRRSLLRYLMRCEDQIAFVLDRLRVEPTETKLWLLREMPILPIWRRNASVAPALDALIDRDASPSVIQQALETQRVLHMQRLRERLDARLEAGDPTLVAALREEQEKWISLERGAMLPGFLRRLDRPFTVTPPARPVRVVAFGDFGTGEPSQLHVAAAIRRMHRARPFDFGITLGDNFYHVGLGSPHDPRWDTEWEQVYGPLRVPFYATLGNHDWYDRDAPAAEILRSRESRSWRMPASYYTFRAGWAQFFAIDSDGWSERQADWLRAALEASTARWKIVYGHHPTYVSSPPPGNPQYREEMAQWAAKLMPILAGRADVLLAGHHHSLQHLDTPAGVPLFITGGGGAPTYPVGRASTGGGAELRFAEATFGFAVLEIGPRELTVQLVEAERGVRYAHSLRRPAGP